MTNLPPPPTDLADLPAGTHLRAGLGVATILPDMDFETYSDAGYVWDGVKWGCLPGASNQNKGIKIIGAARYAEHPSTEVLLLAYDLKDGNGKRQWRPGLPLPYDLFNHIDSGGLIEAWNCSFEHYIWTKVCMPRYGFPGLHPRQLRDAMAKARAHALPGKLDNAGDVLNIKNKKDKIGATLINYFCIPRNPTKTNTALRNSFNPDHDEKSRQFARYNIRDIEAEAELSSLIPDLSSDELQFWLCDQAINYRGVQIDFDSINNCISILEQAQRKYLPELSALTNGRVNSASEVQKIIKWLAEHGVFTETLGEDAATELLKNTELPPAIRRVLQIRLMLASASVKKLYAMRNQVCSDGRLRDLFIYHSARTGRAAGAGPQPQNLPNSGPNVLLCGGCKKHHPLQCDTCPWCGFNESTPAAQEFPSKQVEWNADAVEDALITINTGSLDAVEFIWGNAINIISSCLRGLFIAAPGHDLLCSDYSAIEAVVLAALSGEEWRLDVFRTHGKIYEMSAAKITGIPFEEFEAHQIKTGGIRQPDGSIKGGQHHPMRKRIGKVAELAAGYQGWVKAWLDFGAGEFFSEEEIRKAAGTWRKANPAIVEMWGGQFDPYTKAPKYYGLEGAAIQAVLNPGMKYEYRGLSYIKYGDVLYCKLLSDRYITYHRPRLTTNTQRGGLQLSYEGWNTNAKYGPTGWIRLNTYGGKLTENVVQATARDILAHAIVNLEHAGYPVVLHVHDEVVSEVLENAGNIGEFERIMSTMPAWAHDWPIRASGGWRGKRYRK
jgi:DNA polymerase